MLCPSPQKSAKSAQHWARVVGMPSIQAWIRVAPELDKRCSACPALRLGLAPEPNILSMLGLAPEPHKGILIYRSLFIYFSGGVGRKNHSKDMQHTPTCLASPILPDSFTNKRTTNSCIKMETKTKYIASSHFCLIIIQ